MEKGARPWGRYWRPETARDKEVVGEIEDAFEHQVKRRARSRLLLDVPNDTTCIDLADYMEWTLFPRLARTHRMQIVALKKEIAGFALFYTFVFQTGQQVSLCF